MAKIEMCECACEAGVNGEKLASCSFAKVETGGFWLSHTWKKGDICFKGYDGTIHRLANGTVVTKSQYGAYGDYSDLRFIALKTGDKFSITI